MTIKQDGVPTGPGGCPAALIVRGEHFWCDREAPHGWPHGSTAAEAIWRGSGPAEAPATGPTEIRVEQVARAIWECQFGAVPWDELPPECTSTRADYRRLAAAAIAALQPPAPNPEEDL